MLRMAIWIISVSFILSLLINPSSCEDKTSGPCISHTASEDLRSIPENFSNSSCYDVEQRRETILTENNTRTIKLNVNSSCVNTAQVELEVLLSGSTTCYDQSFLYVHRESECGYKKRCQGSKLLYNIDQNITVCLVKCPTKDIDSNQYQVQLIHGLDYSPQTICGLRIACTETQRWRAPPKWPVGDRPVIYRSFDTNICFRLYGATLEQSDLSDLAIWTVKLSEQWVSLGDLSLFACLPNPITCGPEGGSFSVWMKVSECGNGANGFISSLSAGTTGFFCRCENEKMRCGVRLRTGTIAMENLEFQFNSWFHLVFVYHGPNDGHGITVHLNSTTSRAMNSGSSRADQDSTGEVFIGKLHMDRTTDYSNVMIDELTFWNRQLSETEVEALRNKYEM